MKRTFRSLRLLLPALFALCLLMFSGCQSRESSSTLTILPDGSGSRVIRCVIRNGELAKRVSGGKEAFSALLQKACPKEFSLEENSGRFDTAYTFTLSFDSIDEYKRKAESLLKKPPYVEYLCPESVFAEGVAIREGFTSDDLMAWLNEALRSAGLLTGDSPLFSVTGCDVVLEGKSYPCQGPAEAVSLAYLPVDRVAVDTKLLESGGYRRTVTVQIPAATCKALEGRLDAYFLSIQPEGAEPLWKDLPSGRLYSVSFTAEDAASLAALTNTALGDTNGSASLTTNKKNLFSSSHEFTETLDFSSFPSNRDGKTYMEYTFDAAGHSEVSAASVKSCGAPVDAAGLTMENRYAFAGDSSVFSIVMTSQNDVSVTGVHLSLNNLGDGTYSKALTLAFEDAGSGASAAADYFNSLATSHSAVTVSGAQCILTITGSPEEINEDQALIFGAGNILSNSASYGFQPYDTQTLEDQLNLSGFLEKIAFTGQPTYSYSAQRQPDEFHETGSGGATQVFSGDQAEVCRTLYHTNESIALSAVTRTLNPWFFSAAGGGVLLISAAVFVLFFLLRRKSRSVKKEPQFELLEEPCPACGAFRYADMRYCTKCGMDFTPQEAQKTETKKE